MSGSSDDRSFDQACMDRALDLAQLGRGRVEPNPMVGCVIARGHRMIAEGYHEKYGGPHAEVKALQACEDTSGTTLFVTLEPCCHQGKTPPCTDTIVKAGVQRVVIAHRDPFPRVDGGGVQALQQAGIRVDVGLSSKQAENLNAPYLKLIRRQRPWVIAKWAMTLDGKIASRSRESQWISGEASREIVHQLRGRVDAILVGSGTAKADDPLLTARPPGTRSATRIVVDSRAMLDLSSRLVKTARQTPVLIAASQIAEADRCSALERAGCQVFRCKGDTRHDQMRSLLDELGRRRMTNLLVEGGATIFGNLLEIAEIDELHIFVAPKLMGGRDALSPIAGLGFERPDKALRLKIVSNTQVGDDVHIHGFVSRECEAGA